MGWLLGHCWEMGCTSGLDVPCAWITEAVKGDEGAEGQAPADQGRQAETMATLDQSCDFRATPRGGVCA